MTACLIISSGFLALQLFERDLTQTARITGMSLVDLFFSLLACYLNLLSVEVTGKKRKEKIYKRHTGYPGGLREITFEKLQAKKPEEIIRHAVKGMLPDGKLGRQMYKKLKVYAGPEHPHTAQKPETWEF